MKIIKPYFEFIDEPDALKKIELCGRVCYKSESKITAGSAETFVKNLSLAQAQNLAGLLSQSFNLQALFPALSDTAKTPLPVENPVQNKSDFNSENNLVKTPVTKNVAWDLALRLAVNDLINGEKKRAVVLISAGKAGLNAFDKYSL